MSETDILKHRSLLEQASAAMDDGRVDKAKEILIDIVKIADKLMLFMFIHDYDTYLRTMSDDRINPV